MFNMATDYINKFAVSEKNFDTFHLTTTKYCGNMKDINERNCFCRTNGITPGKIVFANQVHGSAVRKVSANDCGTFVDSCDGLITGDKNTILCIFTADCMPVFMASRDYSVVALVHAGWRGLACGIIESALIRFKEDFGISPRDVFSYIGPHISQCCYQVGDDVKKAFNITSCDTANISLSKQAVKQMEQFGLKRIYVNNRCTCHETEMFFSYRREPSDKRMMSLICAK